MNSRLNNAEHISDLENRIIEISQLEQQMKDKFKKIKQHMMSMGQYESCQLGFQKEKEEKRGLYIYMKLWLKTSQI